MGRYTVLISNADDPGAEQLSRLFIANGHEAKLTDLGFAELVSNTPECYMVIASVDSTPSDEIADAVNKLMSGEFPKAAVLTDCYRYPCDFPVCRDDVSFFQRPFTLLGLYRAVSERVPELPKVLNSREKLSGKIAAALMRLGYKRSSSGFEQLFETVLFVLENPGRGLSLNKEIFPELAEKSGTTVSAVEKSVRMLNKRVWSSAPVSYVEEVFGIKGFPGGSLPGSKKIVSALARFISEYSTEEIEQRLSRR